MILPGLLVLILIYFLSHKSFCFSTWYKFDDWIGMKTMRNNIVFPNFNNYSHYLISSDLNQPRKWSSFILRACPYYNLQYNLSYYFRADESSRCMKFCATSVCRFNCVVIFSLNCDYIFEKLMQTFRICHSLYVLNIEDPVEFFTYSRKLS